MKKIKLSEIKEKYGVGFGTSGIRALVTDLKEEIVYAYTLGFIKYLKSKENLKGQVAIAGDLRESTPTLMKVVAKAVIDSGFEVINCGLIPTPAVAFFGINRDIPSIMVTGSHIPADRNGIKFYKAEGEITKDDEKGILETEIEYENESYIGILPPVSNEAKEMYTGRYSQIFTPKCLEGMKIGLYAHSAVGREITQKVLENLGAKVEVFRKSEMFIPVDTEVIDEELVKMGKEWAKDKVYQALVSTDGDGDRPLLGDENGEWLRSDILGILTAKYLKAKTVVVPISCNTAVDRCGYFQKVVKTKIGSPYIVEEMAKETDGVVGYEANGGFFTEQLPTRDALLPILCWLITAKEKNLKISEILTTLPKRFTESDSIKGFPTEKSLEIINREEVIKYLEGKFGKVKEIDKTDGLRLLLTNGNIIHLRPSMNSPEFRNYVETDTLEGEKELSKKIHDIILEWNQ